MAKLKFKLIGMEQAYQFPIDAVNAIRNATGGNNPDPSTRYVFVKKDAHNELVVVGEMLGNMVITENDDYLEFYDEQDSNPVT